MFIKYPKVHRLGKEETDGILDEEVTVQEKLDGANVSIWIDEQGEIHTATRNKEITQGFNGFVDYVKNNKEIRTLLEDNPSYTLYGEWLVRHTISYSEGAYQKFYLFDILDRNRFEEDFEPEKLAGMFIDTDDVASIADFYGIPRPQIFGKGKITEKEAEEFVGKTNLGTVGEGVVIKADNFVNKFGGHSYAKIVSQQFKEDNGITFGGNNKHSETYGEMYVVNKYATLARVEKVMNKLQPLIDERLDLEHIPRIANTCYHDMLTEEIWEIAKKVPALNLKDLKRLANKKFIQIYKDKINGDVSIADRKN